MATLFQFSIRNLLVAVAVCAVGIAALLNANVWWEAAAWIIALFLLGSAILLVVYRRDEKRAFWLGFAIFGGLYLGVYLFVALIEWPASYLGGTPVQYHSIVTSRISQLAYEAVIPESRRAEYIPAPGDSSAPLPPAAYGYGYQMVVTAPTAGLPYTPPPAVVPQPIPPTTTYTPGTTVLPAPLPPGPGSAFAPNPSYVSLATFVSIAHSLWLLLAAAIGGKVCQWIQRTRPQLQPNPSP